MKTQLNNNNNVIKGAFPPMASPDYLRDANSSKYILCEKIMDYYRRKGQHQNIQLRVEREGNAFVVRSNIVFKVSSLYKKVN